VVVSEEPFEFAGGWDTDILDGHRLIFHIGAGMVEYARLADVGLTVILLTNNEGFKPVSDDRWRHAVLRSCTRQT